MLIINELKWDSWNKNHLLSHGVTINEVYEVCSGKFMAKMSYRKRIIIIGKTRMDRELIIILSPEDRNLKVYGSGIYYPITAFEEI
ncbi:hypothetical protein CO005_03605 [Candidatus Roizmanbacteria bacterium CG_4_8_14_3_um_filter_34_9]|uniref:DUF4258 domain-containing protein n=2 Tax=Candidatus Roizmaniibacteriota TaxID=1752723 RepID=A0A2M6YT06_9BACT|nr:MAG: hypothetical protein COT02_05285 [Candidatus Roizmanbacteria bacterium CG07_land_8_20_14_0_80_34_15]PIW73022.1 MAG: hypothetical protein CO005_03605 [Candidatus Roizmanbacteria bacterium CG_4_8_14_3_um_filter_34_9]